MFGTPGFNELNSDFETVGFSQIDSGPRTNNALGGGFVWRTERAVRPSWITLRTVHGKTAILDLGACDADHMGINSLDSDQAAGSFFLQTE